MQSKSICITVDASCCWPRAQRRSGCSCGRSTRRASSSWTRRSRLCVQRWAWKGEEALGQQGWRQGGCLPIPQTAVACPLLHSVEWMSMAEQGIGFLACCLAARHRITPGYACIHARAGEAGAGAGAHEEQGRGGMQEAGARLAGHQAAEGAAGFCQTGLCALDAAAPATTALRPWRSCALCPRLSVHPLPPRPRRRQVVLHRAMEKSAKEFAEWKRQRDRELLQLKKQGRLNAAQLQKLEALHSKQQAVLRRKTGGWMGLVGGQEGLARAGGVAAQLTAERASCRCRMPRPLPQCPRYPQPRCRGGGGCAAPAERNGGPPAAAGLPPHHRPAGTARRAPLHSAACRHYGSCRRAAAAAHRRRRSGALGALCFGGGRQRGG